MGVIKVNKIDLRRINSKLRQIGIDGEKNATAALKSFALNSSNDIRKDSPIDTGNLRKSIKGQMVTPKQAVVESLAFGEDDFDYAPVQEFGSPTRKGIPYFYPNIYKNLKKTVAVLKAKTKRSVKK